ncbi:DDE transposase family protein [cf. Phormidesmis sp. LEGE 11477]|uniref:DDE transposase family protein n=1 Tax=cf. Phormidesmis sp. LEGE 11477 TaxID=1828680 RepID=UPI00187F1F19|nr:DDE transposase family protein [cf. Phormidesmis sp. LEGE 11477]MBE9059637.1 DDE transposase family protein [cf. Phormidesmis sp. LEGE 11477]
MSSEENWYIVKQESQECKIVSEQELEASTASDSETASPTEVPSQWGPFETQEQAIAKRIGLIRAGKCQPAI